jgi:hypothetical protein
MAVPGLGPLALARVAAEDQGGLDVSTFRSPSQALSDGDDPERPGRSALGSWRDQAVCGTIIAARDA